MKWKKALIFILFLLTGIVLGTLLTSLCSSVSFLNWLTIGEQIGIGVPNPIVLDIGVMTLSFGFAVNINIVKMLCILLCLWLYKIFSKEI